MPRLERKSLSIGKTVMSEHHRTVLPAVPRLPLSVILAFAVIGLGGAVFLAYTSFSHGGAGHSIVPNNDMPVYAARAVPFDGHPEDIAQRATAIVEALTATASQVKSSQPTRVDETGETASQPTLLPETTGQLRGFLRFANAATANNYLAITGVSFGMSAQMAPSGFAAPDAETATAAAVPEASTWLCGAALLGLVAARGIHASWHRNQRRIANKSGPARGS
jgi:hypothetical protein